MSFRLNDDRVCVLADEESEETASGLVVLADAGKNPLRYGTVSHVGSGRISDLTGNPIQIWCDEGDRVFWHRSSGMELEIDDETYIVLSPREIIGVVDTSEPDE